MMENNYIPNTFHIEARCKRLVQIESVAELQKQLAALTSADGPLLVVGGGSNLLFTKDYPGTVFHIAIPGISHVRTEGDDVYVRVGAGVVFDELIAHCLDNGWYGAENLSLIPGEVGASAVQNIGAYGVEAKDLIHEVEVVDTSSCQPLVIAAEDCHYGYRQSRFKGEWKGKYVVTHVVFRLHATFVPHLDYGNIRSQLSEEGILQPTASDLRRIIIRIRQTKLPDPLVEGNAGSFFMNPVVERSVYERLVAVYPQMPHYDVDELHVKIPAGWLIEQCGWKGKSLGRAAVHSRQALVLVNKGGATGAEVLALCHAVRHAVSSRFGIDIHPEVNIF